MVDVRETLVPGLEKREGLRGDRGGGRGEAKRMRDSQVFFFLEAIYSSVSEKPFTACNR